MSAAALRELWGHRELFWFLVWRDVKVRYKQTVLGALWAVLQPFLTMAIFVFIGRLASLPTGGVPAPVFFFAVLVPWTYFANALTGSSQSLVSNAQLLTKVWFPRLTLPAAPVLAGLLDFVIASAVLGLMLAWFGVAPSPAVVIWPLLVLLTAACALGFGLILSALNVRYRDVKYALPFLVQIWLFASPILWSYADITRLVKNGELPALAQTAVAANPMCGVIEAFRASLLGTSPIEWPLLGTSAALIAVVLAAGLTYFHRTERAFADVI